MKLLFGDADDGDVATVEADGAADDAEFLTGAIERMWAEPQTPYLLEVAIDTAANAYPKIAFGHPISEMEPFVAPKAMEST